MAPRFVAVVDIGKTNAKLVLHDLVERRDVTMRSTPNQVSTNGPYPHYDVDRLFDFIVAALREIAAGHSIDAIAITAHGACAVLATDDGLAMPVLDYEFDLSGSETYAYETMRPAFAETQSPRMPKGLNLGNQIFWQQQRFPEAFARVRSIFTYAQYWAWRLSGVARFEPTGLGSHTDLWAPDRGDFSGIVDALGWRALFPPRGTPFEVLGPLKPAIAEAAGVGPVPVISGIHDSNASLLPHLLARPAPFTVVSTGTWLVSFAIGGRPAALDASNGTAAYVDAFGRPVPTAMFMGGREFDLLTGGTTTEPHESDIAAVIDAGMMALPSFVAGSGPVPGRAGNWIIPGMTAPGELPPARRTAVASLYAAMMTDTVLRLIGADGPTVVEGPFARNALYVQALAELTGRPAKASLFSTGTSGGAALLALGRTDGLQAAAVADMAAPAPTGIHGLQAYAERWREEALATLAR